MAGSNSDWNTCRGLKKAELVVAAAAGGKASHRLLLLLLLLRSPRAPGALCALP
jgi:hypothetical protein